MPRALTTHCRIAGYLLALSAVLSSFSCARRDDSPPPPDEFKVCVLLTGPVNDEGWNQSAWEGVQRIGAELSAKTAKVESLDKSAFEESFRQLASEGFDLIFGHAYEFQDAALRVAADYPNTMFVVIAGNKAAMNVGAVHFELEDATYVLGALAAKLSGTKVAGMIGGEEIPSLKPGFDGFVNGARSVDPSFEVVTKYLGSWNDVALAREHAEALVEQGARFLFQNADKAGLGVFQAAAEHEGVYAFGSNKDQNEVVPGVVLASAVIDVPAAYLAIARGVKAGTYTPSARAMGAADGVVSVSLNRALADSLSEEIGPFVVDLSAKVARGEIDPLATP